MGFVGTWGIGGATNTREIKNDFFFGRPWDMDGIAITLERENEK